MSKKQKKKKKQIIGFGYTCAVGPFKGQRVRLYKEQFDNSKAFFAFRKRVYKNKSVKNVRDLRG